jgi:hypothetical protein
MKNSMSKLHQMFMPSIDFQLLDLILLVENISLWSNTRQNPSKKLKMLWLVEKLQ